MPPIKLYYFDTRGVCEPIRQILCYGDIEFEDIRAPLNGMPPTIPEDFKKKSRWSKLPIVEIDGNKTLMESVAIARYFAGKANLIPDKDYEAALSNEYVDATRDMFIMLVTPLMAPDSPEKQANINEAVETVKIKYLNVFNTIVKNNDEKHLVTNNLTWADIYLAHFLEQFHILSGIDLTAGYINLKILKSTVQNTPKIKAWLEKRPKTQF